MRTFIENEHIKKYCDVNNCDIKEIIFDYDCIKVIFSNKRKLIIPLNIHSILNYKDLTCYDYN